MAATSIYFNGRMTRIPGSYSEIDASALDTVGLSASGYLAIVGLALGGKPYSAVDVNDIAGTIQKSTRPGQAKGFFRPGSALLEAEGLAFNPSNDEDIQAGAQRVYWVKANPSIQSTGTLVNADGDSIDLTSVDYGYHTTQIFAEVGTGTDSGKKYTFTFEDTIEVIDNVGGTAIFSVQYEATTPALGFTTITCAVSSTATTMAFTRTQAGLDSDISNQVNVVGYAASAKIEIVSSSGSDTAVKVKIYGVDESGDEIIEEVTTNGLSAVSTTDSFNSVHGARISSGTPVGTLTLRNLSGGTTILTLSAGSTTSGLGVASDMVVAGSAVSVVCDAANGRRLTIVGLGSDGAETSEALTLNGTTTVAGSTLFTRIDYIAVGDVQAARTVTVSGNAIYMLHSAYDEVSKADAWVNAKAGWTWTTVTGDLDFDPADLDITAATNCLSPAEPSFYATLALGVEAINAGSNLVTAAAASGATSCPSNTTDPVFLTGGHEGDATPGNEATPTASASNWQGAFDLLKKLFVNTIVPLTGDDTVHAVAKDHEAYMNAAGGMERDIIIGLMDTANPPTTYPTKTEIKSQIIDLNSRNIRCVAQKCERYTTAGVKTVQQPYYTAVLAAGMQAGSSVGTSLTHKYVNTLGMYQDSTWHPVDDADEMIEMGLLFMEMVDGVGRRWVRNVTTHLTTSNIAYTEGSVNEAVNYTAYNFRTSMEAAVGKKGFSGTIQAAEGVAKSILTLLMDEALTAWRSLDIDLVLDVLDVSVEVAPVIPVNFVKNTIHLIATPQT
jgi:hypothetical protein